MQPTRPFSLVGTQIGISLNNPIGGYTSTISFPEAVPPDTVLFKITPTINFRLTVFRSTDSSIPPQPIYTYMFSQQELGTKEFNQITFEIVYQGTNPPIVNQGTKATVSLTGTQLKVTSAYGSNAPQVIYTFLIQQAIPTDITKAIKVVFAQGDYNFVVTQNAPVGSNAIQSSSVLSSLNQIAQIDECDPAEAPQVIIEDIQSLGTNLGKCVINVNDIIIYSGATSTALICPETGIFQSTFVKEPQIQYTIKYRPNGNTNGNGNNNKCGCDSTPSINPLIDIPEITSYDRIVNDSLADRVAFLVEVYNITFPDVDGVPETIFYERLSFYSIVKYSLAGLIYNDFNVKYLLRRYYPQFLIDLRNSRFSKFEIFFTNPLIGFSDFTKYFLFDLPNLDQFLRNLENNGTNKGNNKCRRIGNTQNTTIQIKPRHT